ncbi:MAG: TonB family protein [Rhodocyclales bacterium]|nr:TonB family protein [Rhodocyclales bacterium]
MTPGFSCSDPLIATEPPVRRALRFTVILAAHVAVLWGGFELASRPEVRQAAQEIMVRLIEAPPSVQEVKLPEPAPPRPQPVRRETPIQAPQPVLTAAPEAPAPAVAIAPPPPAPVAEAAPPAPPVVTAARFDADYLSNPKPHYPTASRRLGEEGKVLLRVKVSPGGAPMVVEIKHSCGFGRLDEAAKAAVERWKFVPARRGDEAIESWVSVPVVFSLQAS